MAIQSGFGIGEKPSQGDMLAEFVGSKIEPVPLTPLTLPKPIHGICIICDYGRANAPVGPDAPLCFRHANEVHTYTHSLEDTCNDHDKHGGHCNCKAVTA